MATPVRRLKGADILMSGEIKTSHAINALMIGISGTGVGALIGGVWFLAVFGTMGVNWAPNKPDLPFIRCTKGGRCLVGFN